MFCPWTTLVLCLCHMGFSMILLDEMYCQGVNSGSFRLVMLRSAAVVLGFMGLGGCDFALNSLSGRMSSAPDLLVGFCAFAS